MRTSPEAAGTRFGLVLFSSVSCTTYTFFFFLRFAGTFAAGSTRRAKQGPRREKKSEKRQVRGRRRKTCGRRGRAAAGSSANEKTFFLMKMRNRFSPAENERPFARQNNFPAKSKPLNPLPHAGSPPRSPRRGSRPAPLRTARCAASSATERPALHRAFPAVPRSLPVRNRETRG